MQTTTFSLETQFGSTNAYVAAPDGNDAATPVVILIQEWWGINDHMRDLAGRYAEAGYGCVVPDLYRGKLAKDAEEAAEFMNALELNDGVDTIRAAFKEAKARHQEAKIGITGFCMGGTFSLRAAIDVAGFSAAVPFYGDIPGDEVLAKLTVPTLFIAGLRDGWINPAKVATLEAAAAAHNLPIETVSYDADHAFFNDTRPEVYDAEAAADAWKRVLAHFGRHLRGE
ncbi:MAG: dienelactone hydrolase family protein [Pyrinomonadaceae bacterium]